MKKIEAYQTSDGTKFLKKSDAKSHENKLKYKAKVEDITDYLYGLLGIKDMNNGDDGEDAEEQFCEILDGEVKHSLSTLVDDLRELSTKEIIDFIIDIATIADGAILKTAQYAKEIASPKKR